MSEDFATCIKKERERLQAELDALGTSIGESIARVRDIEKELAAIDAYEAAKTGKTQTPARNGAAARARKGSRRQDILDAVASAPDGMSRGDLLERFGVKGDKSGEMSISNALTALTNKTGQLVREGGRYRLATQPEAPEQAEQVLPAAAE